MMNWFPLTRLATHATAIAGSPGGFYGIHRCALEFHFKTSSDIEITLLDKRDIHLHKDIALVLNLHQHIEQLKRLEYNL